MVEWFKAHAWKACDVKASVGSNPILSANLKKGENFMKTEAFFSKLEEIFKQSPEQASLFAKSFIAKKFKKDKDSWCEGAKRMLKGGMLFLMFKKQPVTVNGLKDFFDLQTIKEDRKESITKKLAKAPGYVQECFVGIVDNASNTFNGYFGILANYVDLL